MCRCGASASGVPVLLGQVAHSRWGQRCGSALAELDGQGEVEAAWSSYAPKNARYAYGRGEGQRTA